MLEENHPTDNSVSLKRNETVMEKFPEDLEEFFSIYPEVTKKTMKGNGKAPFQICERNLNFTNTPNKPLKREGVLFITQRRQATSDLRENPKVRRKLCSFYLRLICRLR